GFAGRRPGGQTRGHARDRRDHRSHLRRVAGGRSGSDDRQLPGARVERARPDVSAPEFWEHLYAGGQDGWDLGASAPPLLAWLDAGGRFSPSDIAVPYARVAVPGSGRGHDARALAHHGYEVRGFDFAVAAIADARRLAAVEHVNVTFEQRDVFTLAADYAAYFDAVWE